MTPEELLTQIAKHWGWEVGDKVRAEINAIIAANDVDIQQLQSAIQTIQGLLDADESTPEFDVGQNIVAQLADHLSRITGLENQVSVLNGDVTQVGSVAYAVKQERDRAQAAEANLQEQIDTLNGDENTDGSVAKAIQDALNAETAARSAETSGIQGQVDALQNEIDTTQAGAGLNGDGTYTAKSDANYIANATSLKDADEKLDAAIKQVDTDAQAAAATAEANAKAYADSTFVTKDAIANISAATLASIFRQALDCGFGGKPKDDVLNGTGDCATAGGSDAGSGDGAVI